MPAQHKRRGRKAKEERRERAEKRQASSANGMLVIDIDPDKIITALEAKADEFQALGREMTEAEAIDFITDQIFLQASFRPTR